jgi:hypothetical protein
MSVKPSGPIAVGAGDWTLNETTGMETSRDKALAVYGARGIQDYDGGDYRKIRATLMA